jgi:hypothetical protein
VEENRDRAATENVTVLPECIALPVFQEDDSTEFAISRISYAAILTCMLFRSEWLIFGRRDSHQW